MKNLLIAAVALISLVACQSADQKSNGPKLTDAQKQNAVSDTANYTAIKWIDSTYLNLGKVKKGSVVEVSYRFRNAGTKPLVITKVTAGCGCTIPEQPERPFAPGEEGVIRAKFDTQNQHLGENAKTVGVESNTNPPYLNLVFRVEIIE